MKRKIIFILIFIVFVSCEKKAEIGIDNIKVPKYYKEYNFRDFNDSIAKSRGLKIDHNPNTKIKRLDLKDNISKNFLTIQELLNGMFGLTKNERIKFLKEELNATVKVMNERYEIYQGNSNGIDDLTNEKVNCYRTYYLIKNDSACFEVCYCTYNNDLKKIKDYQSIVNSIESECEKGSVFKTSVKNQQHKPTIAN